MLNIKLSGRFIERVNQQRSHACILGHRNRSQDSILEQRSSQFFSLAGHIDSQSPQHHDRDRIRYIASHCARCIGVRYCTNSQRVVAQHAIKFSNQHKGSTRAGYLVGESAPLEPLIKNWLTAIEFSAVVD